MYVGVKLYAMVKYKLHKCADISHLPLVGILFKKLAFAGQTGIVLGLEKTVEHVLCEVLAHGSGKAELQRYLSGCRSCHILISPFGLPRASCKSAYLSIATPLTWMFTLGLMPVMELTAEATALCASEATREMLQQ